MKTFNPVTDTDLYEVYYHEMSYMFDPEVDTLEKVCYYACDHIRARALFREDHPTATIWSVDIEEDHF